MTNTTMKKVAATLAALSLCSAAIAPAAVSAAKITITDSATNLAVSARSFAAYKVFSANQLTSDDPSTAEDEATYGYVVSEDWVEFFEDEFELDADGSQFDADAAKALLDYVKDGGSYATQLLAQKLKAYATANDLTADKNAVEGVINVGDDTGYYLVVETTDTGGNQVISALMLDTVTADIGITLKADQPTIDKVIVDGTEVEANNAAIGEDVAYRLYADMPSMNGYISYDYIIEDTMSAGLTFNPNSVVVKVGTATLTKDTDYILETTINDDGTTTFTIELLNLVQWTDVDTDGAYSYKDTFTAKYAAAKDAVVVDYTAKLDEDAVIGDAGNPNTVKLTYSNNPNVTIDSETGDFTPSDDTTDTPEDDVETYVTELIINKVGPDQTTALDGAEFTLYSDAACTTPIKLEQITLDNGTTRWVVAQDQANTSSTTTAVEADLGTLTIYGLAEGTYYIKETKAPDGGYNILDTVITVVANCAEPTDVETHETATGPWTYTVSNSANSGDVTNPSTNTIKVVNRAGSLLPSTGGIGTTIFVVVGLALMTGAAGLFIVKRKVSAK